MKFYVRDCFVRLGGLTITSLRGTKQSLKSEANCYFKKSGGSLLNTEISLFPIIVIVFSHG